MIPGFDPVSASRRLEALVAAIQAFPVERRPTVLREYLDAELGRLEAMEDAHHAYLAECVMLAIDNMQDARLQSVEDRLAALESPDGPSIAETLTEAAMVFALSLATLAAVEVAGGAVLLWAGQAAMAPAARKVLEDADDALLATARTQVSSLSQLKATQTLRAEHLKGAATVLDALRGGSLSSALWQVGKALLNPIATARSIAEAMSKTFTLTAEMEAIQARMLVSHLALAEGMEVSVKARLDFDRALVGDAGRPDVLWRDFLDNAAGSLALAPAYNVFQNLWKRVPPASQKAAEKTIAQPFLASTPAGRLLTLMRDNRMAVREEYALLRAGLRFRADETLVADPVVQTLAGVVTELAPLRSAYRNLDDSVRPLIVRGYEAALWWAYLQTNGMLVRNDDTPYESDSEDLERGEIVEGHVITALPPRVVPAPTVYLDPVDAQDSYVYEADYYPGVPLLGVDRAEYLYRTFAEPYFRIPEHAAKLPFDYDPAAYVGVKAMPERLYGGLLVNLERTRRINELRLMAILFFIELPALQDPTSSGMLTALGELRGSPPSTAAWLALHPAGTPAEPTNPLRDGSVARAARASAPALAALLSDTGVLGPAFYESRRAALLAAIAELRGDITEMQAMATGELTPAASTRGVDLEAYDRLVKAEQKALLDLYAQVLTSAQFDSAEVTRIETHFEALVERLSTWSLPATPIKVPGSSWRLPAPSPTP